MDEGKPNCVTTTEIDYILTNRPDIVTDVQIINQVNIGSDHRLVMSNNKLDVELERKTIDGQEATKNRCLIIGSKKIEFQLELRNRFETLQELDDIDTMSDTITDIIQQSAPRVAKAISKPHILRTSSQTRATIMKRREMAGHGNSKQRIEYA